MHYGVIMKTESISILNRSEPEPALMGESIVLLIPTNFIRRRMKGLAQHIPPNEYGSIPIGILPEGIF